MLSKSVMIMSGFLGLMVTMSANANTLSQGGPGKLSCVVDQQQIREEVARWSGPVMTKDGVQLYDTESVRVYGNQCRGTGIKWFIKTHCVVSWELGNWGNTIMCE